jgi:SAM-dependent methyltransferase
MNMAFPEDAGIQALEAGERNLRGYLKRKSDLVASLVEGKRVHEVGCGIGTLTRVLSSMGKDVLASDISEECLSRARERGIRATFLKLDICSYSIKFSNAFDCVIMSNVLEHVADDHQALLNAREMLRKGGVLVLLVPAFKFLFSDFDKRVGHFRRYSSTDLSTKLKETGLRLQYMRYWDVVGLIGWLLKCRLMKSARLAEDLGNPSYDRIYHLWLGLERVIPFPFGVDIVATARK